MNGAGTCSKVSCHMLKSTRAALCLAFLNSPLVFNGALHSSNAEEAAAPAISSDVGEIFAPVSLRGYGTVSGVFRTMPGGSVLEITCEDAGKAKLLQAKYLSDLHVLPGVAKESGKKFASHEVEGQGSVAAFFDANKVTILAAESRQALATLIAQVKPAGTTTAQVEVPMYLDRWDRFGWRFYYRHLPWQFPKGYDRITYNLLKDFDDAESLDHSGFVFWNPGCQINGAEGMMMESQMEWAARSADARRLPIAVNSGNDLGTTFPFLFNRYPEQVRQKMPQFVGNFHKVADPYLGALGTASLGSPLLDDAGLGILQQSVRRFAAMPSLVSFLEPHQELSHGSSDILFEYGPVADAGYRGYLKNKYKTTDALSLRWFGAPGKIASWDDVRIPELASFLGWNDRAIDLKGAWAVGYEELIDPKLVITREMNDKLYNKRVDSKPAPKEWFSEKFDDSSWPRVTAPGDDQTMFMQHRPAVFRRSIALDEAQLSEHPRWWLYVWDLNDAFQPPDKMTAYVNGRMAGESSNDSPAHRAAFEVTQLIKSGSNQISLRLPKGYLGYRVYLSPDEPKQYPRLGEGGNAQWVDLTEWTIASRLAQVRRGMEMLRQVDANRPITLMAPDQYADGVKTLAEEYGGEFHNTGHMGVFYADYLPGLMQGADLPFSIELGEPAKDLAEFKKTMGLYLIENVQSVDYYDHIGKLLWDPAMRKDLEDNLKLYHLFGKYHSPKADLAVLFSTQAKVLTGFPWGNDPNTNLMSGYFPWNISSPLRGSYSYDFLSESSFASGDADKYRIIIDSNTSIIGEDTIAGLEKWVRNGGVFITSGQTGRHTSTKPDAWPISTLSGYQIARVDKYGPNGLPLETHKLSPTPGQNVFSKEWDGVVANGLGLRKVTPDCEDWMQWDDGTTAVGVRHLGKGMVIHVGAKFGAAKDLLERIELNPGSELMKRFHDLYARILESQQVAKVPVSVPASLVFARHYVSNNGLYDVWTVWNENSAPITTDLVFAEGFNPASALEVSTGKTLTPVAIDGGYRIKGIALDPLQSRGFLTPRNRIETAPRDWFALQRNWWRGTTKPTEEKFPTVESVQTFVMDLSDDWAFKPLHASEDAKPLTVAEFDDASWKRMRLGIWTVEYPQTRRGIFRKIFRVPDQWNNGEIMLWLQAWVMPTFSDTGNVYLDGLLIESKNSRGIPGKKLESLKPGTEHVLAVEIEGKSSLNGFLGAAWLSYLPKPVATLDLAGKWTGSKDALHYDSPLTLPGTWNAWLAKRTVTLDRQQAGKTVLLHYSGTADLTGVIINGRWVRQDHHQTAKEWVLNITPWVKFGEDNEIQVGRLPGPGSGSIDKLSLDFYEPGTYP